jgi:hypothetical protein
MQHLPFVGIVSTDGKRNKNDSTTIFMICNGLDFESGLSELRPISAAVLRHHTVQNVLQIDGFEQQLNCLTCCIGSDLFYNYVSTCNGYVPASS